MKKLIPFALLALNLSASAFASGKVLLVCDAGGATVTVLATDSNKKVSLEMNDTAAFFLGGVHEARDLPATLESNDSGSTAGPIDLLEVGSFVSSGDCGFGLEFNTNNQRLGRNRDIPLKPSFSYNKVECKGKRLELESCVLGPDLVSVQSLKNFIQIEVAD